MKRLVTALALGCVLSISARAGEIPTLGTPQPPPQGAITSTSPGDIPISGSPCQLSGDALSALLSWLRFLTV